MTTLTKPIGILGGTFDPIHYGHLRSAIELKHTLDLEEVRLIPCYQPVHRKSPVASSSARLAMVKKAIEDEPALTVDTCEIDRKGPSYTIDTLLFLRKKYPHTPFCLIMGIDALLNFPSWNRFEEILELAHLVVVHRPQYHLPHAGKVADLLKTRLIRHPDELAKSLNGKILLQPVTLLEISATEIRKQISMGLNPRFLLPDSVLDYIQKNSIYSLS